MFTQRRGGAQANSASNVGQRRQGNANQQQGGYASGPVNPNQTNKPMTQTPVQQQQRQTPLSQQPQPQLQHQQQQQKLQQQTPIRQGPAQQETSQQQQKPQQFLPQQQAQPANLPQQPKVIFKTETPSVENTTTNGNELEEGADGAAPRKKPFWMRSGTNRVNKRERARRRNDRLRRLLQPKNALMVLNELVGSTAYTVSEGADLYDGSVFKCSVTVDGKEHLGVGKSKPAAKGAAAEAALKYLVLTRFKAAQKAPEVQIKTDADGDEKMEEGGEQPGEGGISWSHVASYALHKLLTDWDEGANLAERLALNTSVSPGKTKAGEKKPAKKLPDTASTMNPIMLLNQMQPNAVYADLERVGMPPHVIFTVTCTVDGNVFHGTGPNKKIARKLCAFGACMKILGIEYSPAFLTEQGVTLDASGNVVVLPSAGDAAMVVAS